MGLDMYLERMPRFENVTPEQVLGIRGYFDWKDAKAKGSKYANCTLKKWCGIDYAALPKRAIKFYQPFYTMKYAIWDNEHKYGHMQIEEEVAYWRKANAIHKWFVENVQAGVDDCGCYEVSQDQLEELLDVCRHVYENPKSAPEYLPTTSGFFFGSTDYGEWYMEDIRHTGEALTKILQETDFNKQMIVYTSSW